MLDHERLSSRRNMNMKLGKEIYIPYFQYILILDIVTPGCYGSTGGWPKLTYTELKLNMLLGRVWCVTVAVFSNWAASVPTD